MPLPRIGVNISSTREGRLAEEPVVWMMDMVKNNPVLHFKLPCARRVCRFLGRL